MAFTVNVVPGSLRVTPKMNTRKPSPALYMNDSQIVCHLTYGFNKAGVPNESWGAAAGGSSIMSAIQDQAWQGEAVFKLNTDNAAEIAKYEFGWIQLMYVGGFTVEYAGQKSALGSIAIDPPFIDTHYLDSDSTHTPWTQTAANRSTIMGSDVFCYTGDHPAFLAKRRAENFHPDFSASLAVQNEFRLIRHSMHFLTVLTQIEKSTLTPLALASFRWKLKYAFDVKYRGGTPVVQNFSELKFEDAKLGEPDFRPDERKIWTARSGKFFNTVAPPMYRAALSKGSAHRRDDKTWFLSVPKDFWQ